MKKLLTPSAIMLALCVAAAPLVAQTGNGSDFTGANVTGSTIAGGVFTPTRSGGVRGAASSSRVAAAVQTAATGLINSMSGGTVTGGGITVSGPAVNTVGALMSSGSPSSAVQAQVSNALGTSGAPAGVVDGLTSALQGLLANPTGAALTNAISAYTALVNSASATFLASPPAEFQAIYAALSSMSSAGNAAHR